MGEKCIKVIESGWRAISIRDAIRLGTKNLPSIDPFADIVPITTKFYLKF